MTMIPTTMTTSPGRSMVMMAGRVITTKITVTDTTATGGEMIMMTRMKTIRMEMATKALSLTARTAARTGHKETLAQGMTAETSWIQTSMRNVFESTLLGKHADWYVQLRLNTSYWV